jgi:hypothetical protein
MLDEAALEKRFSVIEHTVVDLQRRLAAVAVSGNWLEKVTGSISDEAAFREALAYGRAFRQADRPSDEPAEPS